MLVSVAMEDMMESVANCTCVKFKIYLVVNQVALKNLVGLLSGS